MIAYLRGTLASATPLAAVVEIGGIGYEVAIPVTTAERLPANGKEVRLHTHVVYREDSQTLYGFATAEERDFFRLMIERVQNVGPKVALGILGSLSLESLRGAILRGDVGLLAKAKGVGRRTAERLVLDLRDAVGAGVGMREVTEGSLPRSSLAGAEGEKVADAVRALVALGFKPADADAAVRNAMVAVGPGASVEELVRRGLGG